MLTGRLPITKTSCSGWVTVSSGPQCAGTVTEQSNFDPYYVWNKAGGADLASTSWQNPFPNLPPPSSAFPIYLPYTLGSTRSTLPTDPYLKQPYTQQWSASLQYSLSNFLFNLGYVGSASTHLIAGFSPNQPLLASATNPVDGLTVNTVANRALRGPFLGWLPTGISEYKSILTGQYDALQFSVQRRFSSGLSFIAAYTWSHSIDDDGVSAGGRNEPSAPLQATSTIQGARAAIPASTERIVWS